MHGSCWLQVKVEFLMNGLATSALIDSREAPGVCVYGSAVVCNSQDSTHWATGYVHNANKSHKRICSANCTYAVQKGGRSSLQGGGALFLATTMRTGPLRRGRKKALLRVSAASAFARSNCQARRGRPTAPFLPWCATAARSPVSAADSSARRLLDGTARS